MVNTLKLPVGIDSFEKIRRNGFYYIDKTNLIEQILMNWGEVTLFTRPRRFGKTLNMSMLKSFFEIGADAALFEGLYIAKNKELCDAYMGKYPVIFLTLKGVEGLTFADAKRMLGTILANEMDRHYYLKTSDTLTDEDKAYFAKMLTGTDENIKDSIRKLSQLLYKHHGKKAVIIIDEYDVPLDKAYQNGYYREMVSLIRGLFGQALKTNDYLQFAFLTGCLRVSKESIFTGTNNFISDTIISTHLNEYFGFIQKDVEQILRDAGSIDHLERVKSWYDGYHFGRMDVYCPWDVMNYIRDIQRDSDTRPKSYWMNTSDNGIIRSFIDIAGSNITKKLETLLNGGYILQRIDENLTYDYLHSSEDNLWSILYLTGYLTSIRENELKEKLPDGISALMIPNAEIREIFETTVIQWFDDSAKAWDRKKMFSAVWKGDSRTVMEEMNRLLRKTISYHDYREDFYHAFLAGIFAGAGYVVESNKEHGEGRSDVVVYDPEEGRVAIFEAKYSKTLETMDTDCQKALDQINEKMYAKEYEDDFDHILCYGVSFFKKRCCIKLKDAKV